MFPKLHTSLSSDDKITVQVLVDKTGHVVSATAISGNPVLRAAAVRAARQAEFEPVVVNGEAKLVSGVLSYSFKR